MCPVGAPQAEITEVPLQGTGVAVLMARAVDPGYGGSAPSGLGSQRVLTTQRTISTQPARRHEGDRIDGPTGRINVARGDAPGSWKSLNVPCRGTSSRNN